MTVRKAYSNFMMSITDATIFIVIFVVAAPVKIHVDAPT